MHRESRVENILFDPRLYTRRLFFYTCLLQDLLSNAPCIPPSQQWMALKWVIDTQQFVLAFLSFCKPFGSLAWPPWLCFALPCFPSIANLSGALPCQKVPLPGFALPSFANHSRALPGLACLAFLDLAAMALPSLPLLVLSLPCLPLPCFGGTYSEAFCCGPPAMGAFGRRPLHWPIFWGLTIAR